MGNQHPGGYATHSRTNFDDNGGNNGDENAPLLSNTNSNSNSNPSTPNKLAGQLNNKSDTKDRYQLTSFDHVPLDLSLTISPYEKWSRYHRFPFKLVLHLLIIAFSCASMVSRNIEFADFVASTTTTMRLTLGNSADPSLIGPQGITSLYKTSDVYTSMQNALTGFYALNTTSVSYFFLASTVPITVSTTNDTIQLLSTNTDPLSFLSHPVFQLPQEIYSISMLYEYVNTLRKPPGSDTSLPFMDARMKWVAVAQYDFGSGSGRVSYDVTFRNTVMSTNKPTLIVLASFIILFTVLSLCLTVKALLRCYAAYRFAKENLAGTFVIHWERLDFYDKLAFFNTWHFMSALGDILLIFGSIFTLLRQTGEVEDVLGSITPENGLRAFGIFCNFISLLKYCEWHIQFYALVLAVKSSLPRVARFILTVSPIFIAFALIGVSCFSEHASLFGDFGCACRTLFCLLCGDSVLSIFQSLTSNGDSGYRIFAQFYLYTFCVIFITTILNMFIFIIESGYEVAKRTVYGPTPEAPLILDHDRLERIFARVRAARNSHDLTAEFHRDQVLPGNAVHANTQETVSLSLLLDEVRKLREDVENRRAL